MRNLRFEEAKLRVFSQDNAENSIGTLSEKALHKIIKFYIEPNESYHEIKYLSFVADIKREDGIFEIQTRAVYRLLPKLTAFIKSERVTVVLPVTTDKNIVVLDKSTGELSAPKKSTKKENAYTAISSLYGIRTLLTSKNLSVKLIFMKGTDYRAAAAGAGKRTRALKLAFIPSEITEEVDLFEAEDYRRYLFSDIAEEFTVKEFAKHAKCKKEDAYGTLRTLAHIGLISKCGKRGREVLYKQAEI